ncbi:MULTISPECIES: L-lactate dehydrogenase [Demequina]|uniref:L-lactate dehydrogenase n=1 Tax=Demequina litorisediminis TaxID=1849022 RepID=A0ABQ6IHV8_9MICO|nr:L-lactate dehydrogenase [Demequina litorisediminis]GMA36337.1 L-lactate dehydrogenase [Demequina litorisediminis]
MESKTSKVSIVGAGAVGATLAYAGLMRGFARTVALYDINKAKVEAEALDLAQGIQFMPEATVIGSDDVDVVSGSDVVVITAGAKQQPGQSRMDLAGATISLMDKVLPPLLKVAPDAIYILVTNPVDVVTYAAIKKSGMDPAQMFGSGTALDTSRLRHQIAATCDVAVGNVHAYIAGEHGDSEVALWSSASIGGQLLTEWRDRDGNIVMTPEKREQIHHDVMRSAYTIIEGKGATNYAVGAAGARIVEAVLGDQRRIMPVSTLIDYPGVGEVCMSLPAVVGRHGIEHHATVPMNEAETAGLLASAQSIKDVANRFGVA